MLNYDRNIESNVKEGNADDLFSSCLAKISRLWSVCLHSIFHSPDKTQSNWHGHVSLSQPSMSYRSFIIHGITALWNSYSLKYTARLGILPSSSVLRHEKDFFSNFFFPISSNLQQLRSLPFSSSKSFKNSDLYIYKARLIISKTYHENSYVS